MIKELTKYDKDFKKSVVGLLETGEIRSIEEARRKFLIGGSMTLQRWIKKMGKEDLLPKLKLRRMKDEVEFLKESDPALYKAIRKTIAS